MIFIGEDEVLLFKENVEILDIRSPIFIGLIGYSALGRFRSISRITKTITIIAEINKNV